VHVAGLVGVLVVAAVPARPPERPLLRGRRAHEGERELERAAGAEGPVREVAVVAPVIANSRTQKVAAVSSSTTALGG